MLGLQSSAFDILQPERTLAPPLPPPALPAPHSPHIKLPPAAAPITSPQLAPTRSPPSAPSPPLPIVAGLSDPPVPPYPAGPPQSPLDVGTPVQQALLSSSSGSGGLLAAVGGATVLLLLAGYARFKRRRPGRDTDVQITKPRAANSPEEPERTDQHGVQRSSQSYPSCDHRRQEPTATSYVKSAPSSSGAAATIKRMEADMRI